MTTQGIPRPSSAQVPPEKITDEVSGIQVENRDREVWDRAILFAYSQFKDILERMVRNTPADALVPSPRLDEVYRAGAANMEVEPPSRTVVQTGAELVDNAMHDLLNHGCKEVYSDYITIGMIEKWVSSGKGAAYLAALVEAIRTAR